MSPRDIKSIVGGLLFALTGLAFVAGAMEIPIGSARRMGPGYFPLVLGIIAIVLGLLIVAVGLSRPGGLKKRPSWRALTLVAASIAVFGFTIESLGLAPAVVLTVLVAAMADRKSRPLSVAVLAVVVAIGAWLIFVVGLGLPLQMLEVRF